MTKQDNTLNSQTPYPKSNMGLALTLLCLLLTGGIVGRLHLGTVQALEHAPAPSPSLAAAAPDPARYTATLQITLGELGYGEKKLDSPWGIARYSFRLPDNWQVQDGSYLDLDLSYLYNTAEEQNYYGELLVSLDGELLTTYPLDKPAAEHTRLRLDLAPDLLNRTPGSNHSLKIILDASFLCNVPHRAHVQIHPTSTLHLNYALLPPNLDLAVYPRPFYQRAFEPDRLHFVLPARPTAAEMDAAAAIAARLGMLTSGKMVVSTTTDLDVLDMTGDERRQLGHLFVLGTPDRNTLIPWLDDRLELPLPPRRRRLMLGSRGPLTAVPSATLRYTLTLTNTTSEPVSALTLTDHLPRYTTWITCQPECAATDGQVRWSLDALAPGESQTFSLTARLDGEPWSADQPLPLENLAVLTGQGPEPWNISTLTTLLSTDPLTGTQTSTADPETYFFIRDGQPLAEGDGILEEISSPWNPQQVILLISGATEEAFRKAGQALSLEEHLPGMAGPTAQIRAVRPPAPITETLATDRTLADLDYTDVTIYGAHSQEVDYWFFIPQTWQISSSAYFRLLFRHSSVINGQLSALTILLNNTPLVSIPLDQENAQAGDLQVSLPASLIKRGSNNRITVQVQMQSDKEICDQVDPQQIWLFISQDSQLHLAHREQGSGALNLDQYPYPFTSPPDLSGLLFILPEQPDQAEQDSLLRLAAALGSLAGHSDFQPKVALGRPDPETLGRYHLILVGRPSHHPLLQQINDRLPQPFVPGSDQVEHHVGQVLLRLPPGSSVGYIQELPSPWNEDKALLVVTGTDGEGVTWAADRLTRRLWELGGNLVLVQQGGDEIQVLDTRKLTPSGLATAMATAVPVETITTTATPTAEPTAPPAPPTTPPSSENSGGLPLWVMLLAGATLLIIVITFGVALWRSRRR